MLNLTTSKPENELERKKGLLRRCYFEFSALCESEQIMVIPLFHAEDRVAVAAAAKRRLVYLDSNIWIGLIEDEKFPDAAGQCRQAVHSGKVLFPVSNPAVTEVLDQPNPAQRAQVAAFMDELSQGICYLPSDTIYALEADLALGILLGQGVTAVEREQTLSWVGEYLGIGNLDFSSEWNHAEAEKFTRQVAQGSELRSVKWLVDHLPADKMRAGHAGFKKRYVEQMSAQIARDTARVQLFDKNKRRQQILLDLRTCWAISKVVSPRITSNLLKIVGPEKLKDTVAAIIQKAGEGSEDRLMQMMVKMPSLDLSCQIFAEWLLNPTVPIEEQDFHDFEHAVVGAVYSDFFVTSDGYLFDLLKNRCSIPNEAGCCVIRGIEGLVDLLESI